MFEANFLGFVWAVEAPVKGPYVRASKTGTATMVPEWYEWLKDNIEVGQYRHYQSQQQLPSGLTLSRALVMFRFKKDAALFHFMWNCAQ